MCSRSQILLYVPRNASDMSRLFGEEGKMKEARTIEEALPLDRPWLMARP